MFLWLQLRGLGISTTIIGLLGLGGWYVLSDMYGLQIQNEAHVSSFEAAIEELKRQQVGTIRLFLWLMLQAKFSGFGGYSVCV